MHLINHSYFGRLDFSYDNNWVISLFIKMQQSVENGVVQLDNI